MMFVALCIGLVAFLSMAAILNFPGPGDRQ